jgi:filamin
VLNDAVEYHPVMSRQQHSSSKSVLCTGPSKAEVDFKDRKDGSCHVSYTVEEPGEYSVGIRFNDTHIPGSPYKVTQTVLTLIVNCRIIFSYLFFPD